MTEIAIALTEKAQRFLTNPGQVAAMGTFLVALMAWAVGRRVANNRWPTLSKRSAATDAIYAAIGLGGLSAALIAVPFFGAMTSLVNRWAPFLELNLLRGLPGPVQFVILSLVNDFIGYWYHRFSHATPLLWAFHRIHHSQVDLTPLTNYRFHVAEEMLRAIPHVIPAVVLGSSMGPFLTFVWVQGFLSALAHADLPWTYGWIGRLFVSPQFHRIHHGDDANLYLGNYGQFYSIWDILFGTANSTTARPVRYGLRDDVVPQGFLGQLADPFVVIARRIHGRRLAGVSALPSAEPGSMS